MIRLFSLALVALASMSSSLFAAEQWITFAGKDGPGHGKQVVLVSGDEEYRSEEALPQLGKILSRTHGFKCTVLFAIDPATGEINPNNGANIPGSVSYTHLRAHETVLDIVCRLLLEKKNYL